MKKVKTIINLAMLVSFLFITNCGKKAELNITPAVPNKEEIPQNKRLPKPNLGNAEDFVILAYSSINSNSKSSINGKIGLKPGTRDQISINSNEVVGGATDIYGSDDDTIPTNYLSNAKVDMVLAYKGLVGLKADDDKIGINLNFNENKFLKPGCYTWNTDLGINNSFTINGNSDDIWIFKIKGHFHLEKGTKLFLKGGAMAKNIFWQVAGGAILDSESEMVGTIIAQQSVEMMSHSKLIGRAFAKNGFINLDQATIIKP